MPGSHHCKFTVLQFWLFLERTAFYIYKNNLKQKLLVYNFFYYSHCNKNIKASFFTISAYRCLTMIQYIILRSRKLKGNSTLVSKANIDICMYQVLLYWSGLHKKSQIFFRHSTALVYMSAQSSMINLTGLGNRAALFSPKCEVQYNYSLRRRLKASLRADFLRHSGTIAS